MFTKILAPTDGSPLSDKAVTAAIGLAKSTQAQLLVLSVSVPYLPVPPVANGMTPNPDFYLEDLQRMHDDHADQLAQRYVEAAAIHARGAGVSCDTTTAVSFRPHEEIVRAAEKFGCDLVVMASHGRKGIDRFFLGSETQKVLTNSTIPVLVIR